MPSSKFDEKESLCEPPGDGTKVAPLKPIENDQEGGTRSAGDRFDALMRRADVGGIRNADDMAGFVGTSWDVKDLDKMGGPVECARDSVERKMGSKRAMKVMDIIKCIRIYK